MVRPNKWTIRVTLVHTLNPKVKAEQRVFHSRRRLMLSEVCCNRCESGIGLRPGYYARGVWLRRFVVECLSVMGGCDVNKCEWEMGE